MEDIMPGTPADRIMQGIASAAELYYRLVLVVGKIGSGKTAALQEVHKRTGAPFININLELSRLMLDLTERQRALQLPRLLSEIASENRADIVLLDNIEMLFDPALRQDPLRLLKGLSRNRTIVAAWSGCFDGNTLTHAIPGHPEYRRYGRSDTEGVLYVYPE